MRICLLTADPGHPLLAATTELLRAGQHRVELLDPDAGPGSGSVVPAPRRPDEPSAAGAFLPGPLASGPLADVYLLKSHSPRGLALAAYLEDHGAPVLNSASTTGLCQDRTEMAALALAAGLPFAATRTLRTLAELADEGEPQVPLVVKSRHSRRHDLVTRVDTAARLHELARAWPHEPVVVQEFAENSGWDHKLWAVDGHLFAATRRSELSPEGRGENRPADVRDLPAGWADLALRVGEVFGLDVYGVDLLDAGNGTPLIVDINAFPGIRGQSGAPEALAALALRTARRGHAARGLVTGAATRPSPPPSSPVRPPRRRDRDPVPGVGSPGAGGAG
ncbi:RimK family alpha-L-glutamate ligase [Streptomyces sp. NPDC050161]|uniref:RimK family alpha-L-glutamate ligase n=1 Tax=Streptomyces sp. NPDC050161 TaxID=3365604 RepID=UPI0037A92500